MWIILLSCSLLLCASAAPAQAIRRDAANSPAGAATGAPAVPVHTSHPSALRVAASLAAVVGLILVMFLAARRFVPRGALASASGGGATTVLARTAISSKQRVVLLQVGRRILVLADGGHSLNTLCEITDADEVATLTAQLQSERPGGSFSAALNGAIEKFRAAQSPAAHAPPDMNSMREEIDDLTRQLRGMAR